MNMYQSGNYTFVELDVFFDFLFTDFKILSAHNKIVILVLHSDNFALNEVWFTSRFF